MHLVLLKLWAVEVPDFPVGECLLSHCYGIMVLLTCFNLLIFEGLTHLITMDLHQKEIQGFFNIPVDNLRASPFLLQYIQEEVS